MAGRRLACISLKIYRIWMRLQHPNPQIKARKALGFS